MADDKSVSSSRIISLSYLTVRGTPPWEQIDCARNCGFSHVGLRFQPVLDGEPLMPVVGYPERLAATERRLKDTGVKVLDIEFFWIKPDTKIRDFEPYLEAVARLGAQNLLAGANDPDKNRFTDHWLELCDLAAAHDLRVHLEFMPIAAAAVMVDAIHFFRSGSRIAEILPEHHAVMSYMQLCDAPAGRPSTEEIKRQAREDRLPPGRAGLDLIGLLKALPPTLPISIEVPVLATRTQPARERAKLVYDATQELLARLDTTQESLAPLESQSG